jgi:heat shock protein HtpX
VGSFGARIALAVALTAGFYLLGLAIAFGLIGVPVAVWASGETFNIWLSGFMVLTGLTILRALVPPKPDDTGYGLPLAPGDQPRLRAELAAVAAAAGEEPPEAVYISLEVNAAVTEVGGSLIKPGRRVIILGLPLIAGLTREELRAVLAHEYGHYAGGDTRLGRWLWRARMVVIETVTQLHHSESIGRRIVAVPFEWYGKEIGRASCRERVWTIV